MDIDVDFICECGWSGSNDNTGYCDICGKKWCKGCLTCTPENWDVCYSCQDNGDYNNRKFEDKENEDE